MKTSSAGRALVEQREGKRLSAYRDSAGVWTIGVGHTGRMAPPKVTPNMTLTEAQCEAFLTADLAPVETTIDAAVTVPLTQNEFDALASLGFNIGTSGLKRSTVIRKLNVGDIEGAADAFREWARPAVLTGRREAERDQFLTPDAQSGSSEAVATARSQTLSARADAAKTKARVTQTAGGAISLGGATAAVAAAHTGHHHLALIIFAIVAIGAVIDGVVAWWHHQTANALTSNAAKAASPASPALPTQAPPPASLNSVAKG